MSSICEKCVYKPVCSLHTMAKEDCAGLKECSRFSSKLISELELNEYKNAVERMGSFGKLFLDYKGCPRGQAGRSCGPLVQEVISMGVIKDVDGSEWVPVNKDALVELVGRYNLLVGMVGKDPFAKAYEKEDNE